MRVSLEACHLAIFQAHGGSEHSAATVNTSLPHGAGKKAVHTP
jgi:hypothetical protein